jgi:catechol 2,3-dioxygenase-like lactoylglutathione lyase family enzyme
MEKTMHFVIEHIAVAAAHPAALRDWYVRVLSARPVWDNGKSPLVCLIALSGAWLEIYAADAPLAARGNNKLAGWRHVSLRVHSIEAAKAELIRRGVTFDEKIQMAAGGGKILFFKDPEGNLLHLTERPADWHPGKA